MRGAVFLDRDGTIIEDGHYLADPDRVCLLPGAIAALQAFRACGLLLVVVSNQSGVPRGLITSDQHAAVDARVRSLLESHGVPLDGAYYCTHLPGDGCACRKPRPGMLLQAAHDLEVDCARSLMIGDKPSDIVAGRAAGCTTALLGGAADPSVVPDHLAADWPSLLTSLETSWKR